jgi:hypothetical protein
MPPVDDDDDLDATPKTVNNKKAMMEDRDEALSVVKPKVEGRRKVAFGAPEDNRIHVYEQEVKPTRAGTRMNRINALNFVNVDDSDSNSDDEDEDDEGKYVPATKRKDSLILAKKASKQQESLENGSETEAGTTENGVKGDDDSYVYKSPKRIAATLNLESPSRLKHVLDFVDLDSDDTDSDSESGADEGMIAPEKA